MITVFTPTYNRAYILPVLFQSLQKQSNLDFEWLIVDDGSTDGTADLVAALQQTAHFPIRYIYQDNQGKHVAINTGAQQAKGDLFFIVDSDDHLGSNAIQYLLEQSAILAKDPTVAGVAIGIRSIKNSSQKLYSKSLPQHESLLSYTQLTFQLGITGEFATAYKTAIQRQYPYPQYRGENFFRESYVYRQIGKHYKTLYTEEVIYFADYLDDGLTAKSWRMLKQSPKGASLYFKALSNEAIPLKYRLSALNAYWDFQINDIPSPWLEKLRGVSFFWSIVILVNKKLKLKKYY